MHGLRQRWVSILALLLLCPLGLAQPTMDIEQSLDAYQTVDQWVRNWSVSPIDEPQAQEGPAASVAIVTLRVDGRVLGRGTAASIEPDHDVLRLAAARAMRVADAKLTQERDALWDEFIEDLASRVTITLEIADALIPISGSELALPGFGYTPGVLGVAVRRGDRIEASGPESMLMRNTDMTQSAMALANALADDGSAALRLPEELAQAGYVFYRFMPVVLAQPGESMGGAFVDRGGRVIPESEISLGSIRSLGEQIAEHLMSMRWAGIERYGMVGTLDPVTGKNASLFASPFDQGLSAYALLRFGSLAEGPAHRRAVLAGREVLRDLAVVEPGEEPVWDEPMGASMALIALAEIQLIDILGDQELNTLRKRVLEALDRLYAPSTGFDEDLPEGAHGLVVHALVCAAKVDPQDRTDLARSALDLVFEQTPITGLVGQMPFLGWAAIELAGDVDDAGEVPSGDALLAMRSLVWEHQLTRADLDWIDRDLEGGIVFTSSSTPLPSWVATKPLAAISTMLGDPRLTPGTIGAGELPIQVARQIDALRFVHQLCAQGELLHLYRASERASGGIRRALWDQHISAEVDAMALLTLSETTRSFDAILARPKPALDP